MQRFEHVTASTDVYAYCVLPVHLNNEILRFCTGLFEIFNQNNSICKVGNILVRVAAARTARTARTF